VRNLGRQLLSPPMLVGLFALVVALALPAPASAYISLFSPSNYESVRQDESVRFSWYANQSEDFFQVVFSPYPGGFESSRYGSRETVLTSTYVTPGEAGLTLGTWYWTVCGGWYGTPTCYLDDEIRAFEVEEALCVQWSRRASELRRAIRINRARARRAKSRKERRRKQRLVATLRRQLATAEANAC
jgi:hypothetical protein